MSSAGSVEVIAATRAHQPVLANLLELYIYDFSELLGIELDSNGTFGYARLPLYWTDSTRFAYLIRVGGHPAGFALVKRGSEISADAATWDMAEFFVVRHHRRRGAGTAAASAIWRKLPGRWEIRVLAVHETAVRFWEKAIAQFICKQPEAAHVELHGKPWIVYSFESTG